LARSSLLPEIDFAGWRSRGPATLPSFAILPSNKDAQKREAAKKKEAEKKKAAELKEQKRQDSLAKAAASKASKAATKVSK